MTSSLKLGRIAGVEIGIHWSWSVGDVMVRKPVSVDPGMPLDEFMRDCFFPTATLPIR